MTFGLICEARFASRITHPFLVGTQFSLVDLFVVSCVVVRDLGDDDNGALAGLVFDGLERFVSLIEWEDLNFGVDAYFAS